LADNVAINPNTGAKPMKRLVLLLTLVAISAGAATLKIDPEKEIKLIDNQVKDLSHFYDQFAASWQKYLELRENGDPKQRQKYFERAALHAAHQEAIYAHLTKWFEAEAARQK
jgi:hypothetical protein